MIDVAGGNFRLRHGAPGIDAGTNAPVAGAMDLDGAARLSGSAVDFGAYEYEAARTDSDLDGMRDDWELAYGLDPEDAGDAAGQGDADGVANGDEYVADTDPTNAASYFSIEGISGGPPDLVFFDSSSNRAYSLEWGAGLVTGAWAVVPGQANISGNGGGLVMSNSAAIDAGAFYRVRVAVPGE